MTLAMEVYTPAGVRVGPGPVFNIRSVRVTRKLDGAGVLQITVPDNDERVIDTLALERRVRVYSDLGGTKRELGRGIMRDFRYTHDGSGRWLVIDCVDELYEFAYVSVLRGRIYNQQQRGAIVSSLVGLVSGWSASVSDTTVIDARFDGVNVLKALQSLAKRNGLHLRQSVGSKTLEFGAFGAGSGLKVIQPAVGTLGADVNDDVLFLERIELVSSSRELVNRIYPFGGGMGDSYVDLEGSAFSGTYTVQTTTGPDGRTLRYIEDTTSQSTYGVIEKVLVFKQIAPIANNATATAQAATDLNRLAEVHLSRNKDPKDTYNLIVRKPSSTVQVGKKLPLRYRGIVYGTGGAPDVYRDINADFWIMEVTETVSSGGTALSLKVCNVDEVAESVEEIVVGKLEEITIGNVRTEPYFTKYVNTDNFEIDSTHPAAFEVNWTDAVVKGFRCKVRIITRPFRATSAAVAPQTPIPTTSSETPNEMLWAETQSPYDEGPYYFAHVRFGDDVGDTGTPSALDAFLPTERDGAVSLVANTGLTTHSHDLTLPDFDIEYGIVDDTDYPDTVRISINSVDRTSALGGPWGVGGTAVDVELDITDYLNGASPIQQVHDIEISCDDGQGDVKLIYEGYEVIQTIRVV